MTLLRHAFKEWAVTCAALAEGRQAVIPRQGGIAEIEGTFAVEQRRYWSQALGVGAPRGDGG
jgi:hypothetical protein